MSGETLESALRNSEKNWSDLLLKNKRFETIIVTF